jgi:fused signal recognition particle receptor
MPALPLPLPLPSAALLAAVEPAADFGGLLVVLGVLALLAVVAFVATRKPPPPPRLPDDPALRPRTPSLEPADDEAPASAAARRTAKALRRAAKGGLTLDQGGDVRRVGPLSAAEEAQAEAARAAERAQAEAEEAAAARAAQARAKVRGGLAKTRSEGFVGMLGRLFAGKQIDAAILDDVEEVLFRADLGVAATRALLEAVRGELSRGELSSEERVWQALERRAQGILEEVASGPLDVTPAHGPAVLMVVGVNGSGKTTTIGKLAHRYAAEGRRVLVAAGDTFRAAAVDQLAVWCDRAGVEIFRGKEGADPASVCFGAIEHARAGGHDLVICDTAGRLHTNANLMAELQKVHRVVGKAHPGAPHEVLLVLDATMGQNAVAQARQFGEALRVTAIALTKLDGTAKGGVVLAIAEALKIPVKLIGVGEKMEDLRDFEPALFTAALFARDADPEV